MNKVIIFFIALVLSLPIQMLLALLLTVYAQGFGADYQCFSIEMVRHCSLWQAAVESVGTFNVALGLPTIATTAIVYFVIDAWKNGMRWK